MSRLRWRVAAASVRGAAHEKNGLPCQDAHHWVGSAEELLIAAVADGAGSAPLAEVGAAIAAKTAVEAAHRKLSACLERPRHCSSRRKEAPISSAVAEDQSLLTSAATISKASQKEEAPWAQLLTETLAEAKAAVEAEAKTRSVSASDLASTLIVVVAGKDFLAAVQIGDGAVIAAEQGGVMVCVSRPPAGEYLNETTFLTSAQALDGARPVVWRGHLTHLAVISDGLQMAALKMPAAEPHPGFFKPLFNYLDQQSDPNAAQAALASFLGSPRLRERTDDDVTLVLATLLSQ